ncbi:eighth largest subunit of RSC [Spathaspora passalidarum NRRL Y-27907]|uniref:Eighth largest subunit of RSC n=1 Tax=Spathaspora passalidarum (strain NRRL Y-27907 / 11-Y1) TaxID=619300 RepID=G3AP63_SPAPN|nr:eighth largest subunit of RSC [Spathaspora passalidarum NRRL Y-27907]EGW32634.1 eighth largest subunit of RSC [Spathaspora passalidarum NRRL Y-27907]
MSSIDPESTPAVDTPPRAATEEPVASSVDEVTPAASSLEPKVDIDVEKLKAEFQERAKTYLAEQTSHVVIPSFAKWFDLNTVHTIEKKAFPDFFSTDPKNVYKTPQSYKYIRDFLVNTFRLNPKEYLTITAARRNLAGDVTNIIRIHQFLEKWGIINYQIDPRSKPSIVGPQYTGHFQLTLDTPQGLVPYVPENAVLIKSEPEEGEVTNKEIETSTKPAQPSEVSIKDELDLNLEIRRNVFGTGEKKSNFKTNNLVQYACSVCGKDATEVRYHNLKIKTYTYNPSSTINNASILCTLCYEQGLFPSNFQSSDFIQLKKNQEAEEWTEQEILLLLEGIEMFGSFDLPNINGNIHANANSQWEKISEHVGTKTREQCIIKFIQLPIEDKFLTKLIKGNDEDNADDVTTKETLVQEVVQKLIETKPGQDLLKHNSNQNLQESILEEANLINQVIELSLEKFNLKLNKLDKLQESLINIENQLNLERKQVLIERWVQFQKIQTLKREKPELADILDDLIQPVRVNEINKSLNPIKNSEKNDDMQIDQNETKENDDDKLPISVSQPKTYQYWSG